MTNCNCNLFIHIQGESPIKNYIVEMRAVGDRTWKVANLNERVSGNKFTVTGIQEETQYEFRMFTVDKVQPQRPHHLSN